jgi:uncharacterized cupin superfamily protein
MADEHAHVIVMGPGDGPTVGNPAGGGLTYKARSGHTGGALTVWESTAAPGEGPPLHLHVNEDEFMYVLEGRLRFRLDEIEHSGPAGSFVFNRGASSTHGRTRERVMPAFCSCSRRRRPAWSASSSVPRSFLKTRGWQRPSRRSQTTRVWRFSVPRSHRSDAGLWISVGLIAQPAVRGTCHSGAGSPTSRSSA